MNKEIDLQKIEDPLKDYIQNQNNDNPVPLEDYSNVLTKYQLLRLDKNFTPFHITKGCLSNRRINKLIDLLIKKNISLKSLNLSNCFIDFSHLEKLKLFKNLKSLNLHNTFNIFAIKRILKIDSYELGIIENGFITTITDLNLKLLDISNNKFMNKPIQLIKIKSLEILSMEKIKVVDKLGKNIKYSKLSNLKELDISYNTVSKIEIKEISELPKLKLLYCDTLDIQTADDYRNSFDYLVNNIIKIKTLEYLDISHEYVLLYNNYLSPPEIRYGDDYDAYILEDYVLQNINLLISELPKLKKLKCVFKTKYNDNTTREITINGVKVILNDIYS